MFVYLACDSAEVSAVESQYTLVVDHRLYCCSGCRELLRLHTLFDNLSWNSNKARSLYELEGQD